MLKKNPAPGVRTKSRQSGCGAAERMRRSRDRRKHGMRCFTLELRDAEISALVRRGLIAPDQRNDRRSIIRAMYEFLDGSLGPPA
jgi:hypothetical protein